MFLPSHSSAPIHAHQVLGPHLCPSHMYRYTCIIPLVWPLKLPIKDIFKSAWLCQQSSWNRNLSIRLWHRLSPKLLHGFLSNFSCEPWAICPEFFLIFKKQKKFPFLMNIFRFCYMGLYGSENFNSKTLLLLQIAAESFQTFPEFSSQWSSQNRFWDFWNFEFPIFNNFISKISNSAL